MTQQPDLVGRVVDYLHHEGAKGFDELEAMMVQTSKDWTPCLQDISEEQAAFQPEPSEHIQTPISGEGPRWCVKEVVGHYLLAERSLNETVAGFAGVTAPRNPGPIVREMGVQSAEYEALPLPSLREELSAFYDETVKLIGALRNSTNIEATFPHPALGPLNLKEWLVFHRGHAMDHIQQIARIKADARYPKA